MQSMQTVELVLRMICLYGYTGYLNPHTADMQRYMCVYIYSIRSQHGIPYKLCNALYLHCMSLLVYASEASSRIAWAHNYVPLTSKSQHKLCFMGMAQR